MGWQEADDLDELTCPITFKTFQDPVFAEDGHTYERSAISEWIDRATKGTAGRRSMFCGAGRRARQLIVFLVACVCVQRGGCRCHPGRACPWERTSCPTTSPDASWICFENARCLNSCLLLGSMTALRGSCSRRHDRSPAEMSISRARGRSLRLLSRALCWDAACLHASFGCSLRSFVSCFTVCRSFS
jgi:hypothetical protein